MFILRATRLATKSEINELHREHCHSMTDLQVAFGLKQMLRHAGVVNLALWLQPRRRLQQVAPDTHEIRFLIRWELLSLRGILCSYWLRGNRDASVWWCNRAAVCESMLHQWHHAGGRKVNHNVGWKGSGYLLMTHQLKKPCRDVARQVPAQARTLSARDGNTCHVSSWDFGAEAVCQFFALLCPPFVMTPGLTDERPSGAFYRYSTSHQWMLFQAFKNLTKRVLKAFKTSKGFSSIRRIPARGSFRGTQQRG